MKINRTLNSLAKSLSMVALVAILAAMQDANVFVQAGVPLAVASIVAVIARALVTFVRAPEEPAR